MVQINDDNYEDLTEESMTAILDALAAGETPKPGPQIDRQTSCPDGRSDHAQENGRAQLRLPPDVDGDGGRAGRGRRVNRSPRGGAGAAMQVSCASLISLSCYLGLLPLPSGGDWKTSLKIIVAIVVIVIAGRSSKA